MGFQHVPTAKPLSSARKMVPEVLPIHPGFPQKASFFEKWSVKLSQTSTYEDMADMALKNGMLVTSCDQQINCSLYKFTL